jgi:CheY-like chemotaxis protein/HPt (histidine-containing phosphotransfer) domain-containing protein
MSVGPLPDELPPGLVEEYLTSARGQLARLAALAQQLQARSNDPAALEELRRELHKIHGSAGSYGFWSASRLAAGMEATARDWEARPDDVEVDRSALTNWFVGRLAEAFQLEAPLPVSQPVAADPVPPPPATAVTHASTAPQVIIVEDDPALGELLEYGLQSRGYRYLTFKNGREALDNLLALPPTQPSPVLLLDVDLPALDGYSIFDILQRERPGQFRVVFTTVHGNEDEQLRGLEAGALDYLVKPISLRVALEKIRHWVGGSA